MLHFVAAMSQLVYGSVSRMRKSAPSVTLAKAGAGAGEIGLTIPLRMQIEPLTLERTHRIMETQGILQAPPECEIVTSRVFTFPRQLVYRAADDGVLPCMALRKATIKVRLWPSVSQNCSSGTAIPTPYSRRRYF